MEGLRYKDVKGKGNEVLDLTSLTEKEFESLVGEFEKQYQEYMSKWRLDGKERTARSYSTYANSPLPSKEDRLLFILIYLKTNPLQVLQGRLFNLPQCKANQWIRVLIPVLHATLKELNLTPARSIAELAKRLGLEQTVAASLVEPIISQTSENIEINPVSPPLFVMMARKEQSRAPQIRLNKKVLIAARQKPIPSKTFY